MHVVVDCTGGPWGDAAILTMLNLSYTNHYDDFLLTEGHTQ